MNEKEMFESTWYPVLVQATNHPKGFLAGIENYVYPNDLPNLTEVYNDHVSKIVNDEMACLIYKNGERLFFRWMVETDDGNFWFSERNLCLLPSGKVLQFD